MTEDDLLILELRHYSSKALARVYCKYKDQMVEEIGKYFYKRSDIEDVFHDGFVSFAQKAHTLKIGGSLEGYLRKCIRNTAFDKIRETKKEDHVLNETFRHSAEAEDILSCEIQKEECLWLRYAFTKLPDIESDIIHIHINDGMSFREITSILRVSSVSKTRRLYHKGMETLRSILNSKEPK